MSFMNKVKNFFYEDIDEEDIRPEEKKKTNLFKKEKDEEPLKEEVVDVKQQTNNDLSERELFKAERTFNFPMDLGDEIFDKEEVVEEEKTIIPKKENVQETYTRSIYRNIAKEEPKKEEKKKFKPTPVISPVYGILDKNYTVSDVIDSDKTKEFSFDKKIVDYDTVRNRAYKELDEELEKTTKHIFYNIDENESTEEEEQKEVEEPSIIITYDEIEIEPIEEAKEIEFKDNEEEVEEETKEPEEDDIAPDIKIDTPKKKRAKKEETKEDLFNLIDNMYNEDEEEEE